MGVSVAIERDLSPHYFVSYSRRQQNTAFALKTVLLGSARSVWLDQDEITIGDDWRDEIRKGINAADELVLLLSDDSIRSEVVRYEVELAQTDRKLIRPIVVEPLLSPIPEYLRHIHFLDVSTLTEPDRWRSLSAHFGVADNHSDELPKLRACRQIWPPFSLEFASQGGRIRAQSYAVQLDKLRSNHCEASTIQLNAGLMHCAAGQWDGGLSLLRSYAHAANNLPGWLFLALHVLRCESVRNAPLVRVKEALSAIMSARHLAANPIVILTAAILETGGANLGDHNVQRRMEEFDAAQRYSADPPSEYIRAFWCLKPSFPVLGPHDRRVRALIKEIAS